MIKVLNVVVDNHIGGIQNRIMSVGKILKKKGVEIIILSTCSSGDFSNIARRSGFIVYNAPIESPKLFTSFKNILKNAYWLIRFPLGVMRTINVIKRESIEIVHVNGLLSLHAVVAAKITRTPLIWHLVGTIYPKIMVKVIRPIFHWSKKIVLVTNNTRGYYLDKKIGEDLVRVIFEPVDVDRFMKTEEQKGNKFLLRSKYQIPIDSFVVGFVGNISPVKGLEYFLEVAKQQKERVEARMFFVIAGKVSSGHTDYLKHLQKIIDIYGLDNDVLIINDFEDVYDIYNIIDIFLMTSISEGTPLVILESMAMELPVIAPDVGGISEQISDGKTGFVVTPMNIDAIISSIQFLLHNPNLIIEMGRAGRNRAIDMFSLEKCVKLHQDLYLEVMNHDN